MVCEDELENRTADLDDVRVVRYDFHAFNRFRAAGAEELGARNEFAGLGAAGNELPDDADAAACAGLEVWVIAERRNLYVGFSCGLEKVRALLHFNRDAVNFEFDHFHDEFFPFPV
jgi:hypothetical protein